MNIGEIYFWHNFNLFGFPLFRFWAYLMKVIAETPRVHWICYLRFYYYHWVDTSTGRLLDIYVFITITGSIPLLVDY